MPPVLCRQDVWLKCSLPWCFSFIGSSSRCVLPSWAQDKINTFHIESNCIILNQHGSDLKSNNRMQKKSGGGGTQTNKTKKITLQKFTLFTYIFSFFVVFTEIKQIWSKSSLYISSSSSSFLFFPDFSLLVHKEVWKKTSGHGLSWAIRPWLPCNSSLSTSTRGN